MTGVQTCALPICKALSIAIGANPSITTSTLPSGAVGTSYSQTLAAANGIAPYTWAVSAGALPDGLTLDPTAGTISGTPTQQGTFNFTVQATDASSTKATKALSIVIVNPITLTTSSLPDATTGVAYSQTIAATGGQDRKSTRLNSSHIPLSRMPSSA